MVQPLDFSSFQLSDALPASLFGRLVGIDAEGRTIQAVEVQAGRAVSYRSKTLVSGLGVTNVVAFGGSVLAVGDGVPAREVGRDLAVESVVDLAGLRRGVCEFPRHDPQTAELHLVATAADGAQTYVVVSAGAFTRRGRPLGAAPGRVTDLAITGDRVVLATDRFVGLMSREADAPIVWFATGSPAPRLLAAHDAAECVVVECATPSYERWTVRTDPAAVTRQLLGHAPAERIRTAWVPFSPLTNHTGVQR